MNDELDGLDAVDLELLVRHRKVSARELFDRAVSRIELRNPNLNAVVATRFEMAVDDIERGLPSGPFTGVPFLVKDLGCDVAGLPSTRGSRLWSANVADADCELAARFKRAGLVILGNTNTPEMGKNASTEPLLHGPARNPWRLTHSTGGSSGGSAAAVAAGIVPIAHANDGGGSIRIPASSCGLVGLKPTRGRTPSFPSAAMFSYPMGIGHVVSTTVRDSAVALDAISGPMPGDPFATAGEDGGFFAALSRPLRRLRIGFGTSTAAGLAAHAAAVDAVERAASLCERYGHVVEQASPVYDPGMVTSAMSVIMGSASVADVIDRLAELGRELRDDDLEPFSRWMHDHCSTLTAVDHVRALRELELVSRQVARFFRSSHDTAAGGYDVWLTPTVAAPVPELGVLDTSSIEAMFTRASAFSQFTAVFNLTGQPGISVPGGHDERGLPVGVQFVGVHGSDMELLQLAAQIEQAQPWPRVAPWPPAPGGAS